MSLPENILEVRVGGEIFGFDADSIEQILRIPPITPLPLSDASVLGIIVISGKVVQTIDLGELLAVAPVDKESDSARVLTIKARDITEAIAVDEVLGMIDVDPSCLEENSDEDSIIIGFYKTKKHVVQLLDLKKIFSLVNLEKFTPSTLEAFSSDEELEKSEQNVRETQRALFFRAGDEFFAIDIEMLRELIFVPSEITPIAGNNAMGMITLRDEVIAMLDMDELLGFPSKTPDSRSRALIASHNGMTTALLVDEVDEVKDIDLASVEPMPDTIAGDIISAVYVDGERIVSIISPDFIRQMVREYNIESEDINNSEDSNNNEVDTMSEVAVFKIGDEEYAFDIEEVQEIIRYETITPIPEAPQYVEGILNLRGSVIPIVSLPARLGFHSEPTEKSKIIVCSACGEKIGFIVDDVNEILFVEEQYISRAQSEESIFDEVINLNEGSRVILKIQVKNILDEETLERIKLMDKD